MVRLSFGGPTSGRSVDFVLWRHWVTQSMMEFDSHNLNCVMLGIRGWSGSFDRKLSSAPLKVSMLQFVVLRTSGGRQLNRRGPLKGSEANRMVLIRCDADEAIVGVIQDRHLLSLFVVLIGVHSKLGVCPSITLHV